MGWEDRGTRLVTLAVSALLAGGAEAASLEALGFQNPSLPSGDVYGVTVGDASGDGSVVVGTRIYSESNPLVNRRAIFWREGLVSEATLIPVNDEEGLTYTGNRAVSISRDGRRAGGGVIAINAEEGIAATFSVPPAGPIAPRLETPFFLAGSGLAAVGEGVIEGLNADGSSFVGWQSRANAEMGIVLPVGFVGPAGENEICSMRGRAISANGSRIAVEWRAGDAFFMICDPLSVEVGSHGSWSPLQLDHVMALSDDGAVAVGQEGGLAALETGGELVVLGDLPGGADESLAVDVSGGGSIVVGWGTLPAGRRAFVWDAEHGMRTIEDVLLERGVDTSGWTFEEATGISNDGRVLVGRGIRPDGFEDGWRAALLPFTTVPLLSPVLALALTLAVGSLGALSAAHTRTRARRSADDLGARRRRRVRGACPGPATSRV